MVVGGLHLRIDKTGLRGGQPKVVVRTTPITQVIIDATTAKALLLFLVAKAGHIAVVVITPHEGHIVGHLQATFQNFQNFFIGYKDLWHLFYIFTIVFADEFALVVDDLLQTVELFFLGFNTFHRTIMDAAHADGKELFATFHLLQALCPVLLNLFAVGDIVIWATFLVVPLGHIVTQQGLAVRSANQDTARVGHLLITFDGKET